MDEPFPGTESETIPGLFWRRLADGRVMRSDRTSDGYRVCAIVSYDPWRIWIVARVKALDYDEIMRAAIADSPGWSYA